MRVAWTVAALCTLTFACSLQAQEADGTAPSDDATQGEVLVDPIVLLGLSAGAGSWNGNGAIGHFSGSLEAGWRSIGLNVIAEGGFAVSGGVPVGTFTPGISVNLSSTQSPPFLRAGYTKFGEAVGFHVGAGLRTADIGSGFRFEARFNYFPTGSDYVFEGMFTFKVGL